MDSSDTDDRDTIPIVAHASPRDKLQVVYIFFYIIGVATLLPWNFFITAKEIDDGGLGFLKTSASMLHHFLIYGITLHTNFIIPGQEEKIAPYYYKFRNTTAPLDEWNTPQYKTDLQHEYLAYMGICANVPNVLMQLANALLTTKLTVNVRIGASVLTIIMVFVFTIVLAQVNTDQWQEVFLVFTLGSVVIFSGASAVFQGGAFGLAGMFPHKYTQSLCAGMGFGGLLASISNIIVLLLGNNPVQTGTIFFLVATAILAIALVTFLVLPKVRYSKHHINLNAERVSLSRSASQRSVINNDGERSLDDVTSFDLADADAWNVLSINGPLVVVFKEIWLLAMSVLLIFFTTLACFPAINAQIAPIHHTPGDKWTNPQMFPQIACYLIFNAGDLSGRMLAKWVNIPSERSIMMQILAILRLCFIPLFMLCNVQPRSSLPVVFNSDVWLIVFMILFAISNGYLGTLCMMYAPKIVPPEHVEIAGAMMSFFLSVGLALGSTVSIFLLKLI